MGILEAKKAALLAGVLLPLGVLAACGSGEKKVNHVSLQPIDVRDGTVGEGDANAANGLNATDSLSVFKRTLYPKLTQWCSGCHAQSNAPFFAATDPAKAQDAILTNQKVDFQDIGKSRIVLRMAQDHHNCPAIGCDEAAKEFTDAITQWSQTMTDQAQQDPPVATTDKLLIADGETITVKSKNPPGVIWLEAEAGTLKAPMAAIDATAASGGKVVQTAAGAGNSSQNANQAINQANLGTATYTFDVKEAGTYVLNGLVNAPTTNNNAFWFRFDNATTLKNWQFAANADMYTWNAAAATVGGAAITTTLAAGSHTLEIRQQKEQAKIDAIVLADDPKFDPSQADKGDHQAQVLTYDLAKLTGIDGAKLQIEVSDYSENAYLFKNPTLVLPSGQVTVKDMKLLINGEFLPQHATYTVVDKTVSAPGGVLSSYALVALKDKGPDQDQFSFSFAVLTGQQ